MRTETKVKNVYTWEELTVEQKQKAIENLYDINVDHDWWEFTYEDAATIGLEIGEFDLGRRSYVKGKFTRSALDVAKAIIEDHGEDCETHKTAQNYLVEYNRLVVEQYQEDADTFCEPGNAPWYEAYCVSNDCINTKDIDQEFLKSLCENYRIILQNEYEYLTSEEAIIESIIANEYASDENGEIA